MTTSETSLEKLTLLQLENLLIDAYKQDFAYTHGNGYETVHFSQMLEMFSEDDFYPLHAAAKLYLTVAPELRTEIVIPMAENAVIAGQPDTTVRTFTI